MPSTVFDGNDITVHYQVTNLGTGPTYPSSWSDAIWLTLGKDQPDPQRGDILLGQFGHSGGVAVGQSYVNNVTVEIPPQVLGDYYITAWTDADQSVYEVQYDVNKNPDAPNDLHGDNFQATPILVLTTPPADLQVTSITAPPTAIGGQDVTIWQVTNNGPNPTNVGEWADAIYINNTPDLTGDPTLVFAVPHDGVLAPGSTTTRRRRSRCRLRQSASTLSWKPTPTPIWRRFRTATGCSCRRSSRWSIRLATRSMGKRSAASRPRTSWTS